MMKRLWAWLSQAVLRFWRWLRRRYGAARRRPSIGLNTSSPRPHPIQPKSPWVRQEIIRLKAVMPQSGCRTITHHFNRRWASRRAMTVGKSYVASTVRRHQYLIHQARCKLKHRVPRPSPRNRIWGGDLLVKSDRHGHPHLPSALVEHASRACPWLQRLQDKPSFRLLQELAQAVRRHGRRQLPRTDYESVVVSRLFRFGLWLLSIRHQRIQPGCPWQNGRVERFIGTVKCELAKESVAVGNNLIIALRDIRAWYNHDRPHDHTIICKVGCPQRSGQGLTSLPRDLGHECSLPTRTRDRDQADRPRNL